MTNVFIFHGTGGYPEENWFGWLRRELERLGCNVIVPQFPTPQDQTPEKWFEVFEKYGKYTSDTILVGHSLGGTFALRVLEKANAPVKATFLVAAAAGVLPLKNFESDRPFIEKPFDWEKIRKNCGKIFVFQSKDDPLVSVGNGEEIAKNLKTELILYEGAGHFNAKAGYTEFEDLLELVKKELGEN